MANFDFSPLFRSTIGFDRMLECLIGRWNRDIRLTGEESYRLTKAVAGFKPEELAIVAEGVALTVTGGNARKAGAHPLTGSAT